MLRIVRLLPNLLSVNIEKLTPRQAQGLLYDLVVMFGDSDA